MRKILLLILVSSLVGCAGATRTDTAKFEILNSGQIAPQDVPKFVDCLNDGFNSSHWGLTNYEVRQSTRADGYRVETYTGTLNYLIISADIFINGKVVLLESESAALINTKGEKQVFEQCLIKFAKP